MKHVLPFALALAIGFLIPRIGYPRCLTIGLGLFAAGTLLLAVSLGGRSYADVLAAFFIIGLGFNLTEFWKISGSTSYDIRTRQFSAAQIQVTSSPMDRR